MQRIAVSKKSNYINICKEILLTNPVKSTFLFSVGLQSTACNLEKVGSDYQFSNNFSKSLFAKANPIRGHPHKFGHFLSYYSVPFYSGQTVEV